MLVGASTRAAAGVLGSGIGYLLGLAMLASIVVADVSALARGEAAHEGVRTGPDLCLVNTWIRDASGCRKGTPPTIPKLDSDQFNFDAFALYDNNENLSLAAVVA